MGLGRRVAIVAAYLVVFWGLLPAGLWRAARELDRRWLGVRPASPSAVVLLAAGAALLAWGMLELWRGGRGLPVSALPPPRFTRRGPYRLVRHPIYFGFDLALLGAGLVAGSPGLAWVIAPAFLPLWMLYAAIEERGLGRRFGEPYRRYRRQVGMLPRAPLYPLAQLLAWAGAFRIRVEGRENVPAHGPGILVANHACYLDGVYLGSPTSRQVHLLTTAEVFRKPFSRWALERLHGIPLRRYRTDPTAMRAVLRLLAEGELVGMFPESERATLGGMQPPLERVARILARLPFPVIPVGISGSYDVGPRWADVLRPGRVTVRVGKPISLAGEDPAGALRQAIKALVDQDPQPARLAGLKRSRLERVLWCCPACLGDGAWSAERLACSGCGARFEPTADGWFRDGQGRSLSLAELAGPVWAAPAAAVTVPGVVALVERPSRGAIRPLERLGTGPLKLSPEGLAFPGLTLPISAIKSVTVERADTLQIAGVDDMWQFRVGERSAFKLQQALERWRAESAAAAVASSRPPARRRGA